MRWARTAELFFCSAIQRALLKNLQLPDKSRLELPSIKHPGERKSRMMPRLLVGERHRDLLLGD